MRLLLCIILTVRLLLFILLSEAAFVYPIDNEVDFCIIFTVRLLLYIFLSEVSFLCHIDSKFVL